MLDDYFEVFIETMGADYASRELNWGQFRNLYTIILRNQTTYFREIYNGKSPEDIELQAHLKENSDNIRLCFDLYDVDHSGYLSYMEMQTMLLEMNLHKQFSKYYNPRYAFDSYCQRIWGGFDVNRDGKISFEEFIHVYNYFH